METQHRMDEIMAEYACLKQIGDYDIELQQVMKPIQGEYKGDVLVILKHLKDISFRAERVISYTEPLDFIAHTFSYTNTITPRTADVSLLGLQEAHFSESGNLILVHDDQSKEEFKVKKEHRVEVISILKDKLGNKFKG